MLFNIKSGLPAIDSLKQEGIDLSASTKEYNGKEKPLRLLLLNLMPIKETTETDFLRILSTSAQPIEIEFIYPASHCSKNTSQQHLQRFYKTFADVRNNEYNGLIVTGAPVELLPFEAIDYWKELTEIFDWAREKINSTFYICWGAQAALYYFYGIRNVKLNEKMFGLFSQKIHNPAHNLFKGFENDFFVPHSRHTGLDEEAIKQCRDLEVLSGSNISGSGIIMSRNGREFYLTGHSEYSLMTLHSEYVRDLNKGLPIKIPQNYYPENNPGLTPVLKWWDHGNLLFKNWLDFFVSQKINLQ